MSGFPVAQTVLNGGGFPVSTGPPPLTIVFEASQKGTLAAAGSPATITLPQATALNDCIVVCINMAGTAAVTVAGAGATWVQAVNENPVGPECLIWVGYACTAAQTTITVTYTGAEGAYALGMFSGVQHTASPVVVAAGNSAGASVNTLTTTNESYTGGQLVVAACATTVTTAWAATTWLHGQATNSLGAQINASTRGLAADYFIAAGTNSNAATYSWTTTANPAQAGIVVLNFGP